MTRVCLRVWHLVLPAYAGMILTLTLFNELYAQCSPRMRG